MDKSLAEAIFPFEKAVWGRSALKCPGSHFKGFPKVSIARAVAGIAFFFLQVTLLLRMAIFSLALPSSLATGMRGKRHICVSTSL